MLFLIRAAVVIGGLSYLAMLRDSTDPALSLAAVPAQALPTHAAVVHSLAVQAQPGQALATVWNGMPADARERMVRDGTDAFVRRLGMQRSPSGDTLADTDRRPPWRGVAPP